ALGEAFGPLGMRAEDGHVLRRRAYLAGPRQFPGSLVILARAERRMPMRLLVVVLGAGLLWVSPAAARQPTLLTARASAGHVVVPFAPGDLIPGVLEVSTRGARAPTGGFVAGSVKVRERLTVAADQATGTAQYRTSRALGPGTYYVAVSGML